MMDAAWKGWQEKGNRPSSFPSFMGLRPAKMEVGLKFNSRERFFCHLIETYHFEEDGFVSEAEAVGMVPSRNLSSIPDETEVFVMIGYGKRLSSTDLFVLKSKRKLKANGEERIVEGGKEKKSSGCLRKKVKNEAEDLREIVNDNSRKDPKEFGMVTMEISSDAQWMKADADSLKKNQV
ncbi:uncharacterized protein MONOS_17543 [Monocercomonoides exilis]|uniref:uncharacterized protein n=1 Tax=Monocercomonoides exilis TaxID=2049356 RepID=UPI0035593FCB|nr:hypothetical protein MONOS_17543 [Monocercomonoides exilis]